MISLKKFINQANQNTDNEEIDNFLNLMKEAYTYQQYLTNKNFKVFKSFLEYIQVLSQNDINALNNTQQKIIYQFRRRSDFKISTEWLHQFLNYCGILSRFWFINCLSFY